MKKVFVNGYGSIGSRLAAFLKDDVEIKLLGVGKYSADERADVAISRGLDVFVPESKLDSFAEYKISGTIESALDDCDIVIDASPGGMGIRNKRSLYEPRNLMVIYQGGETTQGDDAVSNILFNSRSNYEAAAGQRHVMQGSCNVTGMGRILSPLQERYGSMIKRMDITLVRRWADIEQADKSVPDTIEMTSNPHHGTDAKSYLGQDTPLHVRAIKVPTRQMHLHITDIRFDGVAPCCDEIHGIFKDEYGVATLWTAKSTAEIREFAKTTRFNFMDTNMIHIHANMTRSIQDTVSMMYSDDQTGIVIPENHILMQAMLFGRSYAEAATRTEKIFHMSEKKRLLESHFARR